MSKGRRSFNFLKETFTPYQLNVFCRDVACTFMKIKNGHPRDYISRTFWISEPCYYSCIDYAVTHSLVTNEEVNRMQYLKAYNQIVNTRFKTNNKETDDEETEEVVNEEKKTKRTQEYNPEVFYQKAQNHFDNLRATREEYIKLKRENATDAQRIHVTIEYANGKNLFWIGMKYDIPYQAVSYMIEEAIMNDLVEDSIVKLIQDRTLRNTESKDRGLVLSQFTRYKLARDAKREETKA